MRTKLAVTKLACWRLEQRLSSLINRWQIAEEEQRKRAKEIESLRGTIDQQRRAEQW